MKRVTLSDVAAHAGVSKSTVSMVLNNDERVALSTRGRVQSSLVELGYIYDRTAASLRKPQSQAIGMIVTQLTNPYFAEFAEGIQAELDAQGMDVLLGVSGEDIERQARLLRNMSGRRVDGIVLIPAHGTSPAELTISQTPLMLLARRVEGVDVDYVGGDNLAGARQAADHLIADHGCRRPAFIGGFADSSARQERLAGFEAAARDAGVTLAASPTCEPSRRAARKVARELLGGADRPDGVLCFNDNVAFGVVDAVGELGLDVGVDIRVIGFDDVKAAGASRPALASVAVPAFDAGSRAAELLLSRISGERTTTEELVLAAHLQPRATCGCNREGDD